VVHCQHCSTRKQDKTEHFHALVSATLVAPTAWCRWSRSSSCLRMVTTSRTAKAGRLERHGRRHARLKPLYLGDDLFSRQPVCEAVRAVGGHFLFVCKPASHQTIEEYLTGVDLPTLTRTVKRGRQRFEYRYRWLSDVPRRCRCPDRQLAHDRDRQRRR
jgi:hypothetical protein